MAATMARTTLPSALEGIVEDVQLDNVKYLTHNRVYSKIGSSTVIATDPAVIHFGGFQVGQVYRQTLHVRNISATGTRIHIIPPETPYFKARCDDKKGLVAPGIAEVVELEFCPQSYKYYYDCLRIHSEGENMLVPIHGYPVMNETKFPRRIDFGKVALGDTVTKKFKLECKVPIDFEYQIVILEDNPCYKVEPLQGVVPAHGHVKISITFQPLSLATERMELQVRIAEFASEPVVCSVVGSVLPGLARDRLLQSALADGTMTNDGGRGQTQSDMQTHTMNSTKTLSLTMNRLDGTELIMVANKNRHSNKGGGSARGGAGGGDAYTVMLTDLKKTQGSLRDCRLTGPITSKLPTKQPGPGDTVVSGVYVPNTMLNTTSDVTYVLNQQPGKLRIKDVKDAITSKKLEQSAHRAELDAIMAEGMNSGVHPLERPEVPAHIKAALFAQLLSQAEEKARKITLGSGVSIGDDIMCAEEVAEAQQLREYQHTAHQRNTELADAQRLEAVCEPAGALHLPLSSSGDGEDRSQGLSGAAFAATPLSTDHQYQPKWRLIEANSLKKRAAVLIKFQRAVWLLIYGIRLRRNLQRIQGVLAQLGWDKQRLAEESANPVLLISESDRPGTAPTKYLLPDNVRTRPLPLYRDINFTYHGPVAGSHYTDFDELGPKAPREPLEYQVLGYAPEEFPGLTPYTLPLLDQPLEDGAMEERAAEGLQPSGVFSVDDVRALPAMPDAMKQPPFTTLEIGNRYTEDKAYALPEPSWGMDTSFMIQPAVVPFQDSSSQEQLPSMSVRALSNAPCLSSKWLARTQCTPAGSLLPEVVPSLMTGPESGDLLNDSPDDADKPALRLQVPTDEEIAALIPAGMPNMLQYRPNPALNPSASGRSYTSQPQLQGLDTAKLTTADPKSESQDPGCQFELLRWKRQAEVDAEKRHTRSAALDKLKNSQQEWNSKLKVPHMFALHL